MVEAGTTVVGGHSIDDKEPKYGFAVTGTVALEQLTTNAAARPGDVLVLTKPLGMGVATTALKRRMASPELRDKAVKIMAALNAAGAEAMVDAGVRCATDVTGYGLLGHLREVVEASDVSAVVHADQVPVLDGIHQLVAKGVFPDGSARNLESVLEIVDSVVDVNVLKVLADAQTSGGLLITIPPERSDSLIAQLSSQVPVAVVIGEIVEHTGAPRIEVR